MGPLIQTPEVFMKFDILHSVIVLKPAAKVISFTLAQHYKSFLLGSLSTPELKVDEPGRRKLIVSSDF